MHSQVNDIPPWATLTIHFHGPLVDDADALAERTEALAALLAEDPRVGGVETRDPTTLGATRERPELIVYTTPEAIGGLIDTLHALAADLGLGIEAASEVRTDDDWRDSWKKFYAPMIFGDGALLLRPSWIPRRPGDPARELVLDPGRAFGTGQHETTRLCVDLLTELATNAANRPHVVLDLGGGSGILALAAALLFPSIERLVAVDNDPEATETTRENAEHNALAGALEIVTGTLADVHGTFDLVIANIRPSVLIPAARELARRVRPGGTLILSGILVEEGDLVADPYVAAGLILRARPIQNEWTALHLERPAEDQAS